MKKKLLLVLMLIAAVVIMPVVHAEDQITIEDITNEDTFVNNDKATGAMSTSGDVTTITYSTGDFKLLTGTSGGSGNENRPANKAWIGFKITLPTSDVTNYSLRYVKTGEDIVSGTSVSEANKEINVYAGFDDATLRKAVDNATNVEFTYVLTVTTSSGTTTKTIKIVIVPEKITIKDTSEQNDLWNNTEYKEEVEKVMTDIYKDLEGAISVAKGIDTSKYTAESVKALEEAIEDAEAFGKDLTKNNQGDVRTLTKAITTAIANLVVKGDEPVTPGSTATDTNKPGEQAPNTFDAGLVYMGLALSAVGASVVSIKKLRNN